MKYKATIRPIVIAMKTNKMIVPVLICGIIYPPLISLSNILAKKEEKINVEYA